MFVFLHWYMSHFHQVEGLWTVIFFHCIISIRSLEGILARWKNRYLSYEGGIQLVFGCFLGLSHIGSVITLMLLQKFGKLLIILIWDGRKTIPWAKMIMPRIEGELEF